MTGEPIAGTRFPAATTPCASSRARVLSGFADVFELERTRTRAPVFR
jgi:hypothetical protein